MKICIYEHQTDTDKVIVRFEELPLYDYCKRLSFFIDLDECTFYEFVDIFSEFFVPEQMMKRSGRIFLVYPIEKTKEIIGYLKLAQVKPVQLVKGGA